MPGCRVGNRRTDKNARLLGGQPKANKKGAAGGNPAPLTPARRTTELSRFGIGPTRPYEALAIQKSQPCRAVGHSSECRHFENRGGLSRPGCRVGNRRAGKNEAGGGNRTTPTPAGVGQIKNAGSVRAEGIALITERMERVAGIEPPQHRQVLGKQKTRDRCGPKGSR